MSSDIISDTSNKKSVSELLTEIRILQRKNEQLEQKNKELTKENSQLNDQLIFLDDKVTVAIENVEKLKKIADSVIKDKEVIIELLSSKIKLHDDIFTMSVDTLTSCGKTLLTAIAEGSYPSSEVTSTNNNKSDG